MLVVGGLKNGEHNEVQRTSSVPLEIAAEAYRFKISAKIVM